MTDYIQIIGEFYPTASVELTQGGSVSNYNDIIWYTAPIAQSTLDGLLIDIPNTLLTEVIANINNIQTGQSLVYDGNKYVNSKLTLASNNFSNVNIVSPTNGQGLVYNGTQWVNTPLSTTGLTSVGITGSTGLTVTGSPLTSNGSITLTLNTKLQQLSAMTSVGVPYVSSGGVSLALATAGTPNRVLVSDSTGNNIVFSDFLPQGVSIRNNITSGTPNVGLRLTPSITLLTTPINNGIEWNGTNLYITQNNGVRKQIAYIDSFPTYALDDLSDVTITTPSNTQVLSYNGSQWINSSVSATSFSVILNTWTLDTGSYYFTNVVHNLGTQNIVVAMHDVTTNEFVYPDKITIINNNTIQIRVFGNTRSLRCVVLANGTTVAAGGSTPSSIIVQDDAVNITNTPHTTLNFGAGIIATNSGGGVAAISLSNPILRELNWYATSFDNPNTPDWSINALAPAVADPVNTALSVRQFSNTVEQGVGGLFTVPAQATSLNVRIKSRTQTAPGSINIVQPRLYIRSLPNNSSVGVWSAAVNLNNISIPTNTFIQYTSQVFSTSSLNLTPGGLYQFEFTRRTTGLTGGTSLPFNWFLYELTFEFL